MKLIILGTGKWTNAVINSIRNTAGIDLVGVIPDPTVDKDENRFYLNQVGDDVTILPLEISSLEMADLIYACEYRQKVKKNMLIDLFL